MKARTLLCYTAIYIRCLSSASSAVHEPKSFSALQSQMCLHLSLNFKLFSVLVPSNTTAPFYSARQPPLTQQEITFTLKSPLLPFPSPAITIMTLGIIHTNNGKDESI